jgi:hypothetical protein
MRKTLACLLFLFCTTLGWGQGNSCHGVNPQMCTNYTLGNVNLVSGEPTYSFGDNLPNAKTLNVWHLMSGAPALIGLASGYDSTGTSIHYGWTSAGQAWEYVDFTAASNPSTWVQHPELGTVSQVAVGAAGKIWVLKSTAYCTGLNAAWYGIFYWNGSSLVQPSSTSCLSQFGASSDGTLLGVQYPSPGHTMWESTNGGSSWFEPTGTSSALWEYAVPIAGGSAAAVRTDNSIWAVSLGDGSESFLNGSSSHAPAIDDSGNVFVVGMDSYIYH